jgi:mono/diheme cytochrome c family protein
MRAVAVITLLGTLIASPAVAQDVSARRGEVLLTRLCSSCHAVGRSGASPHAMAPPFRTLGRNYRIEALEEALAEGLVSGHPDMPEFKFSAADVGAIIDYLKSIQQ